jgi:hypothetical protein
MLAELRGVAEEEVRFGTQQSALTAIPRLKSLLAR